MGQLMITWTSIAGRENCRFGGLKLCDWAEGS